MTTGTLGPMTRVTVLGMPFVVFEEHGRELETYAARPEGVSTADVYWSDENQAWLIAEGSLDTLQSMSPTMQSAKIRVLREARREGRNVARGFVQNNPRRGPASPPRRKGDVSDLAERAKRLVIQISAAIQDGDPTEGQQRQFTESYAALQAEYDEVKGLLDGIADDLSIGRAIIFTYSDPRSASAATG